MSAKGKADAYNAVPEVEILDGDELMPELEADVRHGSADKLPDADFFNSARRAAWRGPTRWWGDALTLCSEFEDVCDEDDMKATAPK